MCIRSWNFQYRVVAWEPARTDRSEKANNACANPAHDFQEMLENKGFVVQSIIGATENLCDCIVCIIPTISDQAAFFIPHF
jgi:hypothetical protein